MFAGLVLVYVLLESKTSRPDGTLVKRIHPYRRVMFYIMPGRNESIVYFDTQVPVEKLLEYVDQADQRFETDVDLTHCIVAAVAKSFHHNPKMNRFVSGKRLYQRDHVALSFSMKRKRLDKEARLAAVKLFMPEDETVEELILRINDAISVERSGKKTRADREYDLLSLLPRPIFRLTFLAARLCNEFNLLPGWFIRDDPMHVSGFIANLGSLNMGAAYHHLYEWGTCPLFLMFGAIEERPVVEDGQVVVRKMLPIRFAYDERIDDGLTAGLGIKLLERILSDPHTYLGGLAADGSDRVALGDPVDTD